MLAFPAILPATLTLIAKEESERQAEDLDVGSILGAAALAAFAVVVWQYMDDGSAPVVLALATAVWLLGAVVLSLGIASHSRSTTPAEEVDRRASSQPATMIDPIEAQVRQMVQLLGDQLRRAGLRLGVAESLTGGQLAARISEGSQAGEWFRGGIVAYQPATKRKLLGVSDGPVVSERCAVEMARGVSTLLDAEIGLALTGVGGPGPSEGHAPGTVWMAVHTPSGDVARLARFEGRDPSGVCTMSCAFAILLANEALEISEPKPAHGDH